MLFLPICVCSMPFAQVTLMVLVVVFRGRFYQPVLYFVREVQPVLLDYVLHKNWFQPDSFDLIMTAVLSLWLLHRQTKANAGVMFFLYHVHTFVLQVHHSFLCSLLPSKERNQFPWHISDKWAVSVFFVFFFRADCKENSPAYTHAHTQTHTHLTW